MKKSLIKKLALVTGCAVAISSFALMSTACSDKKDKDADETEVEETEDDKDETEATTAATTQETTEAPVEETEAEVIGDDVISETIDVEDLEFDDDDFSFDMPTVDVSSYTNEDVANYAQQYTDLGYWLIPMDETTGDELPEGFVEGFMGMGGDGSLSISDDESSGDGTMEIVVVVLFENREYAETFITEGLEEIGLPEGVETEDGVTYSFEQDGADVTCNVGNDGLLFMSEVMDFGAM